MSDLSYYLRIQGNITGPFDLTQLKQMRRRGQLARFHQVSSDGRSWVAAKTLTEVFQSGHATAIATARPTADARTQPAPIREEEEPVPATIPAPEVEVAPGPAPSDLPICSQDPALSWFFSDGLGFQGPVSSAELQGRVDLGEITPESLVRSVAMADWIPCGQVPGFDFGRAEPTSHPEAVDRAGVALLLRGHEPTTLSKRAHPGDRPGESRRYLVANALLLATLLAVVPLIIMNANRLTELIRSSTRTVLDPVPRDRNPIRPPVPQPNFGEAIPNRFGLPAEPSPDRGRGTGSMVRPNPQGARVGGGMIPPATTPRGGG